MVGVFVKRLCLVNVDARPRVGLHPGVVHVSRSDCLAGQTSLPFQHAWAPHTCSPARPLTQVDDVPSLQVTLQRRDHWIQARWNQDGVPSSLH